MKTLSLTMLIIICILVLKVSDLDGKVNRLQTDLGITQYVLAGTLKTMQEFFLTEDVEE